MIRLQFLVFTAGLVLSVGANYDPNWDSLDSRPLPQWYDDAKVGIFIHWGVFSVPSFGSEWFWEYWQGQKLPQFVSFMEQNYRPGFTYADFATRFTAEFYDPDQWAEIFKAAGARYIVLTSKHHEGFTNWPSNHSWTWNSMELGPKRDLVGDLAAAIRSKAPDVHFGLYHSLFEWFNPIYIQDKNSNFKTNDFVTGKTMPELYELVNNYQPEVIWSDGDAGPDWYWNSTVFLAWLFNESPVKETVVVNDRWGDGVSCHHGSYYTCADRYSPGVLQPHKWENCFTLDKASWGYRRNAPAGDYLSIHDILTQLASTVSCGGNVLINVGPTHEGMIPPIMEERLRQLGSWLDVNGAGIYGSRPWKVQNDTITQGVWYTANHDLTYAIVLQWPRNNTLTLGSVKPSSQTRVNMLGFDGELKFTPLGQGMNVTFPRLSTVTSEWAWVLEMAGVTPS